jgi:hypothetical protein
MSPASIGRQLLASAAPFVKASVMRAPGLCIVLAGELARDRVDVVVPGRS